MSFITIKDNFNRNVLSVVCFAGLLRIALEYERGKILTEGLDAYLDLAYGILFLLTLAAILANSSFRTIKIIFYAPLVVLLCLTLYDRQGLAGSSEINIYVALIVIALTMQGKEPKWFSLALFLGVVVALSMVEYRYHFLTTDFNYKKSNFNWVFMAISSLFVIYYAKWLFDVRKEKLHMLRQELSSRYQILETNTLSLRKKTEELDKLTDSLEKKVEERTQKLNAQKQAMQDYLDLTLKELKIEYEGFASETQKIVAIKEDPVYDMIVRSEARLKEEIDSLISKLDMER